MATGLHNVYQCWKFYTQLLHQRHANKPRSGAKQNQKLLAGHSVCTITNRHYIMVDWWLYNRKVGEDIYLAIMYLTMRFGKQNGRCS